MKLKITAVFLFFTLSLCAQKKDTTVNKSTVDISMLKPPAESDSLVVYITTAPKEVYDKFILYLKGLDEKPSTLKPIFDFIDTYTIVKKIKK